MRSYWKTMMLVGVAGLLLTVSACANNGAMVEPAAVPSEMQVDTSTAQTMCPVMGGAIDKNLYVDYNGKRIYVCCGGCINVVKKDPGKYVTELEAKGITLDKAPAAICPKCGKVKGSATCCKGGVQ